MTVRKKCGTRIRSSLSGQEAPRERPKGNAKAGDRREVIRDKRRSSASKRMPDQPRSFGDAGAGGEQHEVSCQPIGMKGQGLWPLSPTGGPKPTGAFAVLLVRTCQPTSFPARKGGKAEPPPLERRGRDPTAFHRKPGRFRMLEYQSRPAPDARGKDAPVACSCESRNLPSSPRRRTRAPFFRVREAPTRHPGLDPGSTFSSEALWMPDHPRT